MVRKNSKLGDINGAIKSPVFILSILILAIMRLLYLQELDYGIRSYLDIFLIIFVPLSLLGLIGHLFTFFIVYPHKAKNLDELLELYESKYKKGTIPNIFRSNLTEWLLSKKLSKDSLQLEKFVDFYINGFLSSEKESEKSSYFSEPLVFLPSWFWAMVLDRYSKMDSNLFLPVSYYAPNVIDETEIKRGDSYAISSAISFLENIKKVESIAVPPKAASRAYFIFKPLLYLLSFKRRFPYGKYPNKVNSALEQKNINELIEKLKRK